MKRKIENKLNYKGIGLVLIFFILFYILTTYFLDKRVIHAVIDNTNSDNEISNNVNDDVYEGIVNSLYSDFRIMYDVVNNSFKVNQDEVINVGDIEYKLINNFDSVMDGIFTLNGKNNYLNTFSSYFVKNNNGIYLASNLVNYQTYYFRGDDTNIFIVDASSSQIKAIIYEKWTSNSTNTLALIDVVNNDNKWLVDNVSILSNK